MMNALTNEESENKNELIQKYPVSRLLSSYGAIPKLTKTFIYIYLNNSENKQKILNRILKLI